MNASHRTTWSDFCPLLKRYCLFISNGIKSRPPWGGIQELQNLGDSLTFLHSSLCILSSTLCSNQTKWHCFSKTESLCLLPVSEPSLPLPGIPVKPCRPSLHIQVLNPTSPLRTLLRVGFSKNNNKHVSFLESLLCASSHCLLTKTLGGRCIYPQFKDSNTETQSHFKDLPEFARHGQGRIWIQC